MRNQKLNNIKRGDSLIANKSMYNPYFGGIVVTKGEMVRVKQVIRSKGEVTRVSISTGEDSKYKSFAIVSEDHLDFTAAFDMVEDNNHIYPHGVTPGERKTIAAALSSPAHANGAVGAYFTSGSAKVTVDISGGYTNVTIADTAVFGNKSMLELSDLFLFIAENKCLP